jgi:hypothetical protein
MNNYKEIDDKNEWFGATFEITEDFELINDTRSDEERIIDDWSIYTVLKCFLEVSGETVSEEFKNKKEKSDIDFRNLLEKLYDKR